MVGLTTSDMKHLQTYSDAQWDICSTSDNSGSYAWVIDPDYTYPQLSGCGYSLPDRQISDSKLFFFLHDRLGSVRQVIDSDAHVCCLYTYDPYGRLLESDSDLSVNNHLMFTGQFYDAEIDQYYLRARQYCPTTARFTGCDPILGNYNSPLTLHQYLYCLNDPVNRYDLDGRMSLAGTMTSSGIANFLQATFKSALIGAGVGGAFNGVAGGIKNGGMWDWQSAGSGAMKGAMSGAAFGGSAFLSTQGLLALGLQQTSSTIAGLAVGGATSSAIDWYADSNPKDSLSQRMMFGTLFAIGTGTAATGKAYLQGLDELPLAHQIAKSAGSNRLLMNFYDILVEHFAPDNEENE